MKTVCKILDGLFLVSLVVFALMAAVMLVIQCVALGLMNGSLSVWIYDILVPRAGIVSAVTAVSTILLGYLRPGENASGEDD